MIRRCAALVTLLLLPLQAHGQAAQVTSGDHADFTRIVVQYPGAVDWQVGRIPDGYELRLPDSGTAYDLTRVFDLIQKDRLAAIWADPGTGALKLTIACACYAIPFEDRPGPVVIYIRNGTPPAGSAFELALEAGADASLPAAIARPAVPPIRAMDPPLGDPVFDYDWTALALSPPPDPVAFAVGLLTPAAPRRDLDPLRQSLVEQLSRGASAGIVDMARPTQASDPAADENPNPSVEVRTADQQQLILRQKGEADQPMTADGDACFSDEQLDIASWSIAASEFAAAEGGGAGESGHGAAASADNHAAAGSAAAPRGTSTDAAGHDSIGGPLEKELAISMQFAPAMANLIGEFDRPNREAIKRAVRFQLFLGFGAEARGLLRAMPIEDPDIAIWQSLARITDEEADPAPVFSGMAACNTAAALWAVLADPKVLGVGQVQKTAILRAFSGLPTHLRQHFGPTLVDRFLAMQDFGTATVLRDAVTRSGETEADPEVQMMQAAIDKASGSPGASVARLESVAADSGPSNADAMAALVLQRAELGQEVSFDQVQAIEEYTKEREGSLEHEKFNRALTLAYAASGDFDRAFGNLANSPDAASTVWKLLGNAGADSALLNHAVLHDGVEPPGSARSSAGLVASRLLRLGLADQAGRWLAVTNEPPALLSARISVAQGEPEQALMLLADLATPAAIQVRLNAYTQLGDEAAIAQVFADLGMDQERWNAIGRTEDWARLAAEGPEVWKTAAGTLADQPALDSGGGGDLAKGKALIDDSVTTRDAITALLESVKSPVALSQ